VNILRFGDPLELVAAPEDLAFQKIETHLADHVLARPAFALPGPALLTHLVEFSMIAALPKSAEDQFTLCF